MADAVGFALFRFTRTPQRTYIRRKNNTKVRLRSCVRRPRLQVIVLCFVRVKQALQQYPTLKAHRLTVKTINT